MKSIVTQSDSETRKIGEKLAKKLKQGDIICLVGQLGSGKTTFVNGIGRGLGLKGNLRSPSFLLAREYPKIKLCHLDLYRIKADDFLSAGLYQYISKENICVIEWADKISEVLPEEYLEIRFSHDEKNDNWRKLVFIPHGKNISERVGKFL